MNKWQDEEADKHPVKCSKCGGELFNLMKDVDFETGEVRHFVGCVNCEEQIA